ncbi:predicted protein [Naegleria gruberi]|uniref:Predicted protein n=1 Tax=Naegleria gruberi TaxID=5762 RepID=D2V7P5_NAEGR|nr:uncharacterized protein NAEGRDRAFT_64880 [Naegleria gruberi]EFC46907.1 predicted protein [Naegleria gruberi]|eukprot:XP_002679651.1 predicted protein [Naegleria gruberi strain NEG-M]
MEYRQPGTVHSSSNNYSNPFETTPSEKNFPIFHWNIEKEQQTTQIHQQPFSNSPHSSSSYSSLKTTNQLLKFNKTSPPTSSTPPTPKLPSPKILSSAAELRAVSIHVESEKPKLQSFDQTQHYHNETAIFECANSRVRLAKEDTPPSIKIPNNKKIQRTRVFTISELLQQ